MGRELVLSFLSIIFAACLMGDATRAMPRHRHLPADYGRPRMLQPTGRDWPGTLRHRAPSSANSSQQRHTQGPPYQYR
jgi:hypothetical protein